MAWYKKKVETSDSRHMIKAKKINDRIATNVDIENGQRETLLLSEAQHGVKGKGFALMLIETCFTQILAI